MDQKEDLFFSIQNALNGNWELLKPNSCRPPSIDETYVLQHTEDQLDTSLLSTDTDGFDTAHSECEQACDSDLDEFILAEKLVNSLPEDYDLPGNTSDELIYCNSQGHFQKIRSALNWIKRSSTANHIDCAAQISARELTERNCTSNQATSNMLSKLEDSCISGGEDNSRKEDKRTNNSSLETTQNTICEMKTELSIKSAEHVQEPAKVTKKYMTLYSAQTDKHGPEFVT